MRRNQLLWESPLEMIMDVVGAQIVLFPDLQGFKPYSQISFITAQNLTQDIFDDEVYMNGLLLVVFLFSFGGLT